MFTMLRVFRSLFGPLVQAAPPRPKTRRTILQLQELEERWCPATAAWNPVQGNNWTTAANWSWSGNGAAQLQGKDYPGDNAGRTTDDVVLSVNQDCNLFGGLKASLDSLTLPNGYSHTLSISGGVTVQAGYFNFQAGNLTLGSAAMLTIGAGATEGSNTWTGGNFTGAGQITDPLGPFSTSVVIREP
jgi:hypothetical protein